MIDRLSLPQRYGVLSALLLGTLMTALSQLIVTTALPVVIAALGGFELYSWVFAAALLTSILTYPIAGKLSDLLGRKAVYLAGMTIFMVGSGLCGAAQTIEQLVLFRGLQGVGAGCVQPTVAALLADLFPLEQRARWQGINGAIWGLASVLGPVAGGYMAEHWSWRWVFYVNLVPGLVAAVMMAAALPTGEEGRRAVRLDLPGIAWLTGVLGALVLITIWGGKTLAWNSPQILGLGVIALVFTAAFVATERRAVEPVVPPGVYREPRFAIASVLVFLTGAGMFASTTYVPLYLQGVHALSPTMTGLMFLPTIALTSALSVGTGFFMTRIGFQRLAFLTMAIAGAGFLVMAVLPPEAGVLATVASISLVAGALGLSFPVYLLIAQAIAPREHMGVATSLIQLTRSLGGTVGVAALGALLTTRLAHVLGGAGDVHETAALLRPEALATLTTAQVAFLRIELGDAMRTLFAVAAVGLFLGAALTLRLGYIPVPRRGAGALAGRGSAPLGGR